jgi:DNA polymerase-4
MRRILLADADAFFVAVARALDPEGAGRAALLIVGGSRESRGVVCSASYETRKFGVRSAMPIARALRLCPDAMCVPVPMKACGQKSAEIRKLLHRFAPIVEGASIDEWYLDLCGTEGVYHHEPLAATAERIRAAVHEATGLTLSIGGGTNKLIAKMAVPRAKPDGVLIVEPGAEEAFVRSCTLAEIPLVGPKFQARLAARGLITVEDVFPYDVAMLRRKGALSAREATWLWKRVHGVDDSGVAHREVNRGLSRDETFGKDLHDDNDIERELLRLVTRAAADMRGDGLTARTVAVRLRDWDFRTRGAQRTLPEPVVSDRVILRVARELLATLRKARRVPARLVGVRLSGLGAARAEDQFELFTTSPPRDPSSPPDPTGETDRDRGLARAIDRVRGKFGAKSIVPGGLAEEDPRPPVPSLACGHKRQRQSSLATAVTHPVGQRQRSTVRFRDLPRECESDPGAVQLRGVERDEQIGSLGEAGPLVADPDVQPPIPALPPDLHGAAPLDRRVHGIAHQVDQ